MSSAAECSLPDVYLECPVCLHLFTSPVLTDCCHTSVCRGCITNCIRFKMGCPLCRAALKAKPDKAWIRNRQLEAICDNIRASRGDAIPQSPTVAWAAAAAEAAANEQQQQEQEEAAPQRAPLGWLRMLLWPRPNGGANAAAGGGGVWVWVLLAALLLQWSGLDLCGTGGRVLFAAAGVALLWLRYD